MKKNLLLSATGAALCIGILALSSGTAHAQQEMDSLYYYDVPTSEIQAHYNEWRIFLEYNLNREPCQHYQAPPPGYVMRGCDVYRIGVPVTTAVTTKTVTQTAPEKAAVTQSVSTSTYTVHFGFDKSSIPDNEKSVVSRAAQEIKKDNPSEVIVSGYASTAGAEQHNQKLSERRAKSVANELVADGVNIDIIVQKGYGETNLAVQTDNHVKMPANRRAVIEMTR